MKKLLALLTAAIMIVALALPVGADFKYTPIPGEDGKAKFDKYLVVDADADIPDLVFEYTVTGVARKAPTPGSTFEVIGTTEVPHDTMPKMYEETTYLDAAAAASASKENTLTFILSEGKSTTKAASDWLTLDSGKAFAKRTMVVDFSGVTFDEPGIYRYEIEEQQIDGRADIAYDTQASTPGIMKRYMDVYVIEDAAAENGLQIAGYVFHENNDEITPVTGEYGSLNTDAVEWTFGGTAYNDEAAAIAAAETAVVDNSNGTWAYGSKDDYDSEEAAKEAARADVKVTAVELDDKSQGYVNELATYDLEFGKEVEGNQGSKDKYFEYTVTIEGLAEGTVLQLDVETKGAKTPTANSATIYEAGAMAEANSVDDDNDATNGQQLVAPAGGTITKTFYLQDGQYIAIKGIPVGASYTVAEDAEDYKKEDGTVIDTKQVLETIGEALDNKHQDPVTGVIGQKTKKTYEVKADGMFWKDGTEYKALYQGTGENADKVYTDAERTVEYTGARYAIYEDVYTGFTNTRDGVIPTGVAIGFGGALALIALAAMYVLLRRRNAAYED